MVGKNAHPTMFLVGWKPTLQVFSAINACGIVGGLESPPYNSCIYLPFCASLTILDDSKRSIWACFIFKMASLKVEMLSIA